MRLPSLLMTLILLSPPALAGTLTLATHELYPYGYHDSAQAFRGYAVDRCNRELNLLVVPWARAQELTKSDAVDGFFAGSRNEEREALYVASDVLAPQTWIWYLLKDTPLDPDSPDFKHKARVGRGERAARVRPADHRLDFRDLVSRRPSVEHTPSADNDSGDAPGLIGTVVG